MHHERHDIPIAFGVIGCIVLFTYDALIDSGPLTAGVTLAVAAFTVVLASIALTLISAWIGYAAGFHKRDVRGWRFALAFLLMPAAWGPLQVTMFLVPNELLARITPEPMAAELREVSH